jgi:23S rRNA (uridine2552-2'-O)-methyltransferase
MAKTKSSKQWLQEHFHDEYVKLAQQQGYRSRAVFKLIEINQKDKLFRPGINVIDLGAAPGGWSEYVRSVLSKRDKVIALDILSIEPIKGVQFIQGEFTENEVLERLYKELDGASVNVVLSDMAPNLSGNKAMDQPRSMFLAELALDTARTVLVAGGVFLVKVFQGSGSDEFLREIRGSFAQVMIRKPKASRSRSNEIYILAKGFKK